MSICTFHFHILSPSYALRPIFVVRVARCKPSFAASSPYAPPFVYPLPSSPPSAVSSSITRLCPVSLPWCRASEEEKSFYYVDDDDGTRQSAVSGSAGGGGFGVRRSLFIHNVFTNGLTRSAPFTCLRCCCCFLFCVDSVHVCVRRVRRQCSFCMHFV